jgi:hypothetical protein
VCDHDEISARVNLHDLMQNFKKRHKPDVDKLKEPILDKITSALSRDGLNFTKQDTSSLWFLCKQVINFFSFSFFFFIIIFLKNFVTNLIMVVT